MKNGESHVHIMSDLVKSMEEMITNDDEHGDENEASTHLAEYDRLMDETMSDEEETPTENEDENNYYSAQIAAHMTKDSHTHFTHFQDFRPGARY